jgi:uncharacterized protein YkwD
MIISNWVKQKLKVLLQMEKGMELLSYLRRSLVFWQIAMIWVVVGLAVPPVLARETYVQLANRLLDKPQDGAVVRSDLEAMVLRATNAYRAQQKLPPLKPANAVLMLGARAHAMDLLGQAGMGHVSSGGHGFESRIRALHPGQMFLAPMAENAARLRNTPLSDAKKAQALVTQWVKSSGHRKNMINRTYATVAIGVVSQGNNIYAVQIFSGPEVKTNMTGGLQ